MKNSTLLLSTLLLSSTVFGQTFSDDFEGYAAGSYLGVSSPDWTTWSGTPGSSEDVLISTANAASGSNSLYFSSTSSTGGPQDVVLPFNQVYSSGNFSFEGNFFVETGKGAYFNLQGDLTVGQTWAMDCYMLQDGTMKLSNQGTPYLTANFPMATWFNMRVEMDLTSNVWELFIDNVSMGTFSNPTGQIAILDLYPVNPTSEGGNNTSGFYVDDISYNHIPATLPNLNGGVTFVNQLSDISGLTSDVVATVRNLGSTDITSFDISYTYNGNTVNESVGPVSIASLQTYEHTFATPTVVAPGANNLVVTISNINGLGQDDDNTDDSKTISIDPIVPATGKIVVGEEGTGTWCGWCPRGTVYMDLYAQEYGPYWAGIAVHNGDPMVVTEYDAGMGTLISGYPSALVDRGPDVDPSGMNADFLDRLQTAPAAFMTNGATWDAGTRTLTVSVTADFQTAGTDAYKLICVLTEDGVTGTTSGYNQTNYYAGGSNGTMGGFELLSDPVPAAQMVYDHVARAIAPSFTGSSECFPASFNAGEVITHNFEFVLPVDWDESNVHIVGMLASPNGRIDNADHTTISEAVTNGFVQACALEIGEIEGTQVDDMISIAPNPAMGSTTITLNLANDSEVVISLVDMNGKVITTKNYGMIPSSSVELKTSELNPGVYIVEVVANGVHSTKRLIVQ